MLWRLTIRRKILGRIGRNLNRSHWRMQLSRVSWKLHFWIIPVIRFLVKLPWMKKFHVQIREILSICMEIVTGKNKNVTVANICAIKKKKTRLSMSLVNYSLILHCFGFEWKKYEAFEMKMTENTNKNKIPKNWINWQRKRGLKSWVTWWENSIFLPSGFVKVMKLPEEAVTFPFISDGILVENICHVRCSLYRRVYLLND